MEKLNFVKGISYKDFTVESSEYSEAAKSTIIRLKHKSGLTVVHFANKCQDNMVFFGFRTADKTACGTPHIMEHSVLCGSEKYKVKDPFISMANQSVNTFLNAFTYPDFTGYPVSSTNKKDFFNLASVYADAVFFPMLDEGAFMQEGHRLEVDDDGKVSIQGVVYNEMKGAYSDPINVMFQKINETLLPDTIYAKDSGGDPLVIPSLTYQDYLAFHKKWYKVSNCIVGFYGNIPTNELLDFLDTEVISRRNDDGLSVYNDFYKSTTQKKPLNNLVLNEYIPITSSSDESKTFTIAWNLGEAKNLKTQIENKMMSNVLSAHTGSYVLKAITDSGLGQVGQIYGILDDTRYKVLTYTIDNFTGKVEDAKALILDAIKGVVENGIDEDTRQSIVNIEKYDLLRTDKNYQGLNELNRYMHLWIYDYDLDSYANLKSEIDALCEKALKPGYLENLLKTRILENPNNAAFVFNLSSEYVKDFALKENANIEKLMNDCAMNTDVIKEKYKIMKKFQDTFNDTKSLPRISISDLKCGEDVVERNNVRVEYVPAKDNSPIPVLYSEADMPGTVDITVGFPFDKINPEDYKYINLMTKVMSDIGYDDVSWSDANGLMAKYSGYFYNYVSMYPLRKSERTEKLFEKTKDFACRDYFNYTFSCLTENLDKVLHILSRVIQNPNFGEKYFENIVKTYISNKKQDFCSSGRQYAMNRTLANVDVFAAKNEIIDGITEYKYLDNFMKFDETLNKIKEIFITIKESGSIVCFACSSNNKSSTMKSIKNFIKETELKHLSERPNVNPEDFFKAVYNGTTEGKEHIKVNTSTGYAALSFKGLEYMKKGSFVEEAYLNWLNTNTIWSQLRTVHGCYGAHIIPNLVAGKIQFGTYRDPNPVTSNEELLQCLEEGANTKFTEDEVEKLAISAYGDKTQPKSISGKALYFFNRTLSALDDQDRIDNINGILKLTPYDIKGIAKYINKQAKESSSVEAFFVKDVPEGFANKTIEC